MLSKSLLYQATCTFGLLRGHELHLEADADVVILSDFGNHNLPSRGTVTIDRYLAKSEPTEDEDELDIPRPPPADGTPAG